jgi:hypothetical protein
MDLAEVYRIFPLTTRKYTFFSAAHGTFSKTDHILGDKASLSKYKKIEITPGILFDHIAIKLELNNKNSRKFTNNWSLNNTLLNDQWLIEEKERKSKGYWKLMKMKTPSTRTCGTDTANAVLRGKFIVMSAYIKSTERSQKKLMLYLKILKKEEQAKPKTSRRREIIKNKGQN